MSLEIVCVGYTCPICHRRITVLRSCDPVPKVTDGIATKCQCGFACSIEMAQIQALEVWREREANGLRTVAEQISPGRSLL